MSKDTSLISPLHGNTIFLHETVFSGATFTPVATPVTTGGSETGMELGHLAATSFGSATTEDTFKLTNVHRDEVYSNTTIVKTPFTEATLYEMNAIRWVFLEYRTKTQQDLGKFYIQYNYMGIRGAKHQEEFSVVKVQPQSGQTWTDTAGGSSWPYKANKQIIPVAMTASIADALLSLIETAYGVTIYATGPIVIPDLQYEVLVETAV